MKKEYFFILFSFFIALPAFSLSLKDAQKDYIRGDYESAFEKASRLKKTDEVLYFLGLMHSRMGEYDSARANFRNLIGKTENLSLKSQAMIKLADTYFFTKSYEEAESIYYDILTKSIIIEVKPLIYLRLAQIAAKRGNWDEKKKHLTLIKQKYPNSPEMKYVSSLEKMEDFFTIQVGAFTIKKNALALVNELEGQDYSARIEVDDRGSYPVYRVRVGRFKKRYDVEKTHESLADEGYPTHIYP